LTADPGSPDALPPGDTQHFSVFGYPFTFESPSRVAHQRIHSLYGAFAARDGGAAVFSVHPGRESAWVLARDGREVAVRDSLGAALAGLECEVCWGVVAHRSDLILTHGALLLTARGGLLISGPSGAGKSTLTMALVARGYKAGTDDANLLTAENGWLCPVPRCFHLDRQSRTLLREAGMRLPEDGAVREFLTPTDYGATAVPAMPVRWIFLLSRGDSPQPAVAPLSQAEAAVAMLQQTNWGDRSASEMLAAMIRMAGKAKCYRLTSGRLAETADSVIELIRDGTPPAPATSDCAP
jgi:hypothetical protein